MKSKFYVTTAIDYASGSPHLGHLYEKLCADIIARWHRVKGDETFFLTGLDEHGQKIVNKAREEGLSKEDFIESIAKEFLDLIKRYDISNDYFIRTTDKRHKRFIQDMLQRSYEKGDIYLGNYEGLYCVDCERYYTEKDLNEGNVCPYHNKEVTYLKDENYFFRLSKYQDQIIDLIENGNILMPVSRKNEILMRLKDEPLEDISISRKKENLSWGVEFPFDKDHVTYVWFDALFNYISALEMNGKQEFWPCDLHIIGKDISWFHSVYWLAFLLSLGYEVPKKIFSHGFVLDEKMNKMSKSLGNSINPLELVSKYGVDEIRYILMTIGSPANDIPFGESIIKDKLNNELNNDLGNLISRVVVMVQKFFPEKKLFQKPTSVEFTPIDLELIETLKIYSKFESLLEILEYKKAFDLVWEVIRGINKYINLSSPWNITSKDELEKVLYLLLNAINYINNFIKIIMPGKSESIQKQFDFQSSSSLKNFVLVEQKVFLTKKKNLFKKVKAERSKDLLQKSSKVERDPFEDLNLKVGKIIGIIKHPDSVKLYILKIKFSENEVRQIVSGLQEYYLEDELLNKQIVCITNLKSAKLGGYESQGMLLAVEDEDGNCAVLLSDLSIGSNISCDNLIANNSKVINFKRFQKVKMFVKNGQVYYNNKVVNGLEPEKKIEGLVC